MMRLPALSRFFHPFHDNRQVLEKHVNFISLEISPQKFINTTTHEHSSLSETFHNRVTLTVAFFQFVRKILNIEQELFIHFGVKEKKKEISEDQPLLHYEECVSKMRDNFQTLLETLQKFKN